MKLQSLWEQKLIFIFQKEIQILVARVNGTSKAKAGDKIKIALDENKIHIFDKETENTII